MSVKYASSTTVRERVAQDTISKLGRETSGHRDTSSLLQQQLGYRMPKRRQPAETGPDLFDNASGRTAPRSEKSSPAQPTTRYVLPVDVAAALRNLTDAEISRLGNAVVAELDRRGFESPWPADTRHSPVTPSKSPKRLSKHSLPSPEDVPLTTTKTNAIKAALKTGLSPNLIARQFGVRVGAVRQILAEMKRG